MNSSPLSVLPSQQPSSASKIPVCNAETVRGVGVDAAPGSASGDDQTRHITLRAFQSDAGVTYTTPKSNVAGKTLLSEGISSADLSSDAQSPVDEVICYECRHTEHQPAFGEAQGASAGPMLSHPGSPRVADASTAGEEAAIAEADNDRPMHATLASGIFATTSLSDLPNEVLLQVLCYLDVCDLLCTSRTSHRLRDLSLAPILHWYRLQRTRAILPPMLWSPFRPSLADLIRRSIFLTRTTVVSRKLARSLVCIRLSRRLAARPSAEALVARSVLPSECVPSKKTGVAPALVAKKRAVERERVKDSLRRFVERVWRGEVRERSEGVKQWEERVGVGRVWRLRRFWESKGLEMSRVREGGRV